MSELVVVLNVLILAGMVISAVLAVHFDKLLSSITVSYTHLTLPTKA